MMLIVLYSFCLITCLPFKPTKAYPSSSAATTTSSSSSAASSSSPQNYISSLNPSMIDHYLAYPYYENIAAAGSTGSYITPRDHVSRWLTYGWGPAGRQFPEPMLELLNRCTKYPNDRKKCPRPQKRSLYLPLQPTASGSSSSSSSSASPPDPSTLPSINTVDDITSYLVSPTVYDFDSHYNR